MNIKGIWQKEKVCETCHGEKYIECCSTDGSDCERIVCPRCNGTGKVANEEYKLFSAAVILVVVLAIVFLICH